MNGFVLTWPRTTKSHSALVGSTLADPLFAEYEDAHQRLSYLRKRHEKFMMLIRMASAFQAFYFYKNNKSPFTWQFAGRVIAFVVTADLINFNTYYPESREICKVHQELAEKLRLEELHKNGHPDAIYFKTS
jgi:hypothetical protein